MFYMYALKYMHLVCMPGGVLYILRSHWHYVIGSTLTPRVGEGVLGAATRPGVGGGTHRRRATFDSCEVRGVVLRVVGLTRSWKWRRLGCGGGRCSWCFNVYT